MINDLLKNVHFCAVLKKMPDSKMPIRKIKKWLRQNHASNENCDKINTHLKVNNNNSSIIVCIEVCSFIVEQFFGFSQTGEALIVEMKNSEYKQTVNFMLFLKDGLCLTIPGILHLYTSDSNFCLD